MEKLVSNYVQIQHRKYIKWISHNECIHQNSFHDENSKEKGGKNFKTIFEILAQKMIGKIENKVDQKIHEEW